MFLIERCAMFPNFTKCQYYSEFRGPLDPVPKREVTALQEIAFFTAKLLTFQCVICSEMMFQKLCLFSVPGFVWFVKISTHRRFIFCKEKNRIIETRENYVGGWGLSPQAPMKRVAPTLPKLIHLTGSAIHCVKDRSSLETCLNQPWVLTVGQNEYNHFLGYILINPSRDVHVSEAVAFW